MAGTRGRSAMALWALVCAAACGEIRVVPLVGDDATDALLDTVAPDDVAADAGDVTAVQGDVTAVQGDVGDGQGGCHADKECAGLSGKTPCSDPVCDLKTGKCKLQLRAVDDACTDPLQTVPACAETRCDAAGQCVQNVVPDGQVCGVGACGKVCKQGTCIAATAADYDDQNPCTNDYCDQGKKVVHAPLANLELPCNDGNTCTQGDTCVVGVCQGVSVACSDGLNCTTDGCDPKIGCTHVPQLGVCTDGNPCTKDACDVTIGCTVVGFEIASCDDGNPCSGPDLCDKGGCVGQPSTAPDCQCTTDADCTSKSVDLCKGKFYCDAKFSVCAPKPNSAVVCDTSADTACFVTTCDPALALCIHAEVPGNAACDDGNPCTAISACQGGACVGSVQADCSDGKPCTLDQCAADVGCFHVPATGACDDGDVCTGPDACQGGYCQGAKKSCDDGKLCTFDSCDAASGSGACLHTADAGTCVDNNPCTADTCDLTKDCIHTPDDTATCDDGDACTADTCVGGACVVAVVCNCVVNEDCDDQNPCTADACVAGKCQVTDADGKKCTTADKCQLANSGTCGSGVCVAGDAPVDCSAYSDACNVGVCDATSGACQAIPKGAGAPCDDGDGCTEGDTCAGGLCQAGLPLSCPALPASPCVDPVCVSTGAATHVCETKPRAAGVACDDGLFCTVGDACDGQGVCATSPYPCTAPGPCVGVACDEAQKGCTSKLLGAGTACDDGAFCTVDEVCNGAGVCAKGTPRLCDGGTCLTGVCDESQDACTTTQTPNCCDGVTAGLCDDGEACTSDTCVSGLCQHQSATGCCTPELWTANFDDGLWHGVSVTNSTGSPTHGWQLRKGGVSTSAPWAAYYGDASKNNFDFGISSGVLATPSVSLPASLVQPAVFHAHVWYEAEQGASYDKLDVAVVWTDATGAQKKLLLWTKGVEAPAKWIALELTLPIATAGQTVHFEVSFATIDGVLNAGQGVYLDDLNVTVACP